MPADKKPMTDREIRAKKASKQAKNVHTEKKENTATNKTYIKILELCNEDKKKSRGLKDPHKVAKSELKDLEQVVKKELDDLDGDDVEKSSSEDESTEASQDSESNSSSTEKQ